MDGPRLLRRCTLAACLVVVAGGCTGPVVETVEAGSYSAIVPSLEQLDVDAGQALPGGFGVLRRAGVDQLELRVSGDEVTFLLDDEIATERSVTERPLIRDSEGSGPFKAEKELLVLDGGPLVLAGLTIDDPVIWPGSFEESPVVTVKQRDPGDRGPVVSCLPSESCLLLTSGVTSTGTYEDANDPALDQNPIDRIEVSDSIVDFVLDTGERVRVEAGRSTTVACGLSETDLWGVPEGVVEGFDDPVLVHTVCPLSPGAAVQLVIMERGAIPVLAPFGAAYDGEWCPASSSCLWFVPT